MLRETSILCRQFKELRLLCIYRALEHCLPWQRLLSFDLVADECSGLGVALIYVRGEGSLGHVNLGHLDVWGTRVARLV